MRRAIFNAKWLDSQLLASAHGKNNTESHAGSVKTPRKTWNNTKTLCIAF